MKANEITIGDWAMVNDTDHPKPMQVDGIYKKSGAYYAVLSSDLSADVDKVEPIRLTREILEKNGFNGMPYAFLKIEDDKWLEYYYHEHRLRYFWSGIDDWNNHAKVTEITFQCTCMYVHELQHALRLCNIDKTIEL